MIDDRVLLHLADGRRPPQDPREIFFVEADRGDSLVRLRGRKRLRDVRELGEIEELLAPHGFFRIHRDTLVNLRRVRDIRPAGDGGGDGWEVKLDPPVNRVLPVSRRRASDLFAAFGEA